MIMYTYICDISNTYIKRIYRDFPFMMDDNSSTLAIFAMREVISESYMIGFFKFVEWNH